MKRKPDWKAIEADYLATGMAYVDLAKKWNVSISTLKKKAAAGRWGAKLPAVAARAEAAERKGTPQKGTGNRKGTEEPKGTDAKWAEAPDELDGEERVREDAEELGGSEGSDLALDIVPEDLALRLRIERRDRLLRVTDEMMDRIIDALNTIEPGNASAIATLARALKDIRDIQGLSKDALDLEEQKARIQKLRSEVRSGDLEESGGVLLLPLFDDAPVPPTQEAADG